MAVQGVNGLAVATAAAGALLAWSGFKGAKVTTALRSLLSGQQPSAAAAYPITSPSPAASPGAAGGAGAGGAGAVNPNPPNGLTVAQYQAFAMSLLALHGWPGQFPALNGIINAESSWNPNARNPSGAYGIAQALGHGQGAATAGSNGINEYGNFGTPDAICQQANSGRGDAQLIWMLNYIGQVYGTPNQAWAHHQAVGTY